MMPQVPGFDLAAFTHQGRTHQVYRAGSGPAVVVVHELPGIHPGVVEFGQRLVDAGYSVYLPSLFGRPGEPLSLAVTLRSALRVCVAREFTILADRTSPVVGWLRALAAKAHGEYGGPGVGAVGMCFTGGFALAMAVEPAVLASVVSQPALPAPLTARKRAAVGLDAADLERVKERTQHGPCVLGLPRRAVRHVAPRAGRGLRGDRDRLLARQPVRHPCAGARGADRGAGRRARPPHTRRAGPRHGVPRRAPARMTALRASSARRRTQGEIRIGTHWAAVSGCWPRAWVSGGR